MVKPLLLTFVLTRPILTAVEQSREVEECDGVVKDTQDDYRYDRCCAPRFYGHVTYLAMNELDRECTWGNCQYEHGHIKIYEIRVYAVYRTIEMVSVMIIRMYKCMLYLRFLCMLFICRKMPSMS